MLFILIYLLFDLYLETLIKFFNHPPAFPNLMKDLIDLFYGQNCKVKKQYWMYDVKIQYNIYHLVMSENFLNETKIFFIPHPKLKNQNRVAKSKTVSDRLQTKFDSTSFHDILPKTSISSICEKKLKLRIKQLIGDKSRVQKKQLSNELKSNSIKYNRFNIYNKVIQKEKVPDMKNMIQEDSQFQTLLFQSKPIYLQRKNKRISPFQDIEKRKQANKLSTIIRILSINKSNNQTVKPKQKYKPSVSHYRTEPFQISRRKKRKSKSFFQPWQVQDFDQQFSDPYRSSVRP